jgi:putative phosphoribosyl transferase
MKQFRDRVDAAKQLAQKLVSYINNPDVIVLGLARGGVVTAHTLAQELHVPWDVVIVRKIASPRNPEFALGALSEDGSLDLNEHAMQLMGETRESLSDVIDSEEEELERRKQIYRKGKSPKNLRNKIVILTDDGVATGATMRAALKTIRVQQPKKIIIAVPVASAEFVGAMRNQVDDVVVLTMLDPFGAISLFYQEFPQISDEEVIKLLQ